MNWLGWSHIHFLMTFMSRHCLNNMNAARQASRWHLQFVSNVEFVSVELQWGNVVNLKWLFVKLYKMLLRHRCVVNLTSVVPMWKPQNKTCENAVDYFSRVPVNAIIWDQGGLVAKNMTLSVTHLHSGHTCMNWLKSLLTICFGRSGLGSK